MATKGHSVVFEYGNTADHTTASAWTKLFTKVTDIQPYNLEGEAIDISHMESPEQYSERTSGWAEATDVELTAQHIKTEYAAALNTLFRVDKAFRIVFFDGTTLKFNGFLNNLGTTAERKGIVSTTASIVVNGKPVYAATS